MQCPLPVFFIGATAAVLALAGCAGIPVTESGDGRWGGNETSRASRASSIEEVSYASDGRVRMSRTVEDAAPGASGRASGDAAPSRKSGKTNSSPGGASVASLLGGDAPDAAAWRGMADASARPRAARVPIDLAAPSAATATRAIPRRQLDDDDDDEAEADGEPAAPDINLPEGAVLIRSRPPQDALRIRAILREPQPENVPELQTILLDINDEYAPAAALALAFVLDADAAPALRLAFGSLHRADIRAAALEAFASLRAPPDDLNDLLLQGLRDPDYRVREAAAYGVGRALAIQLTEPTRDMVLDGNSRLPEWRAGIWALARLGDEQGLTALIHTAEDADPNPAERDRQQALWALHALGDIRSPRTLPVLYRKLFDDSLPILLAAFAALDANPPSAHDEFLAAIPPDEAGGYVERRTLIRFALGGGPPPERFVELLLVGTERERELAMDGLAGVGGVELLPASIMTLMAYEQSPPPLGMRSPAAARLRQALSAAAARLELPPNPGEMESSLSWRRWWFRLFRVLDSEPGRAVVELPDGSKRQVEPGDALPGGGVVLLSENAGLTRVAVRIDSETLRLRRSGE